MKWLKFALFLIGGIVVGFLLGNGAAWLFGGKSPGNMVEGLLNLKLWEIVVVPLVAIVAMVVAGFLLVLAHEAGHLVCGLLSGYRFVSFRIFNFTFINDYGRVRIKRFAVAGTGGQCLLSPPDGPVETIPTGWYNVGGLLANIVVLAVAVPLLWVDKNPFVQMSLVIFVVVDLIMICMNGIPMKIGGIGNDALNMLMLRTNLKAKRGLIAQLRSNELIQRGVRPRDMPDEIFEFDPDIDYRNQLEVSLPLMRASRLLDMGETEQAYQCLAELYGHKDDLMGLYVNEIACELAYTAMVTGRIDQARELLDAELLKYIEAYRRVMSSKERLLCAKALYIDSDRDAAVRIYENLVGRRSQYLLQGEVASDIDLMRGILFNG